MSTFKIIGHAGGVVIATGDATPEGAFEAPPGSSCTNDATGELYVKASGTGNTGWVKYQRLSATAVLTFGTITALTSAEQDITVTGAVVGDNCYATPQADPGANASWSCYIKTNDKVTVRLTAVATDVTTDRTWRADVWKT